MVALIAKRAGWLIKLVGPLYLACYRQSATNFLVEYLPSAHLAHAVSLNDWQKLMIQHEQKSFFCFGQSRTSGFCLFSAVGSIDVLSFPIFF